MSYLEDAIDYLWLRQDEKRRKETEWASKLLEHEKARSTKAQDPIREYLESGLDRARRAVRELEREIYIRGQLHDQSIEQIDYQISCAAHSLTRFRTWAVGYNRGVDDLRIELGRTLDALRDEKRSRRVSFWNDLVRLRAELRERRREYDAVLRRAKVHRGDRSER